MWPYYELMRAERDEAMRRADQRRRASDMRNQVEQAARLAAASQTPPSDRCAASGWRQLLPRLVWARLRAITTERA